MTTLATHIARFTSALDARRMPPEVAHALHAAAGAHAALLTIEGHSHGGAYRDGTVRYQEAVAALLQQVESNAGRGPAQAGGPRGEATWAATKP